MARRTASADSALTVVVTSFDEDRGLAEVTDDHGSVLPLHCTANSDAPRTINGENKSKLNFIR